MKRNRKSKFLEELKRVPNVSSVCEKLELSRNTIYRWRQEDYEFKKEMDKALGIGVDSVNDLAESKLINHIQRGESWAVKYWLDNHKKDYMRPRPRTFWEEINSKENKIDKVIVEIATTEEEEKQLERVKKFEEKFGELDPSQAQFGNEIIFQDMSGKRHPIEEIDNFTEKEYVHPWDDDLDESKSNKPTGS